MTYLPHVNRIRDYPEPIAELWQVDFGSVHTAIFNWNLLACDSVLFQKNRSIFENDEAAGNRAPNHQLRICLQSNLITLNLSIHPEFKARRIAQKIKTNKAMTGPNRLHQTHFIQRLVRFD